MTATGISKLKIAFKHLAILTGKIEEGTIHRLA
jgi:hypothetical protein